jgi:flagellin-like protein
MQMTPTTFADGDDGSRRKARRGLAIFFAIVALLSAPIQAVIIAADLDGGRNGLILWLALITALMFVPTAAAVAARFVLREGFSDVSFRFGGRRGRNAILQALVLPALIGLLVLNLELVSGEELGWRGYMLTRLIDAGVPRPVLASGVIWGLWHVPLFLWGGFVQGVPPLLATAFLMVLTPSLGYVLARMRLETGSVWPAVALHVAWNVTIQAGFQPLAAGASSQLWVGESGIFTALVLIVVAVIYSHGRWTILREPPKREKAPVHRAGVDAQPRVQ